MTIMASTSILPRDLFGAQIELSKDELKGFVDAGMIAKVDHHKEHFAVQPFWIQDPGQGVMEEINRTVLGKWNSKLKSYVVQVNNVRNDERSAAMNEDHRWLHVNVMATFYTYTPEVGQQLTGEIKKVGSKAAICVVFDVFTATVFANGETELNSWQVGQQLSFEIQSFVHRRKGPIIQARSTAYGGKKIRKIKTEFDIVEPEPMEQDLYGPDNIIAFYADQPTEPESSNSKKKKKSKKWKSESFEEGEQDESMSVKKSELSNGMVSEEYSNEVDVEPIDSVEIGTKSKKKKKKKSSHNE